MIEWSRPSSPLALRIGALVALYGSSVLLLSKLLTVALAVLAPAPAQVERQANFQTPSRNIVCILSPREPPPPNLYESTAMLAERTSRGRPHGPDHDRLAWPGAVAPSLPPTRKPA